MVVFRRLLLNTLATGVTSTFLWFALTFWVYLETRSVVATGVIGGAFSMASALIGPVFGTFVDRHTKKTAMLLTTTVSLASFTIATAVFLAIGTDDLLRLRSPWFWILVGATLFGSVAGQMRAIAMSTCVTLLVPENLRDRANGMVGTVTGVSFAITSVFSGLIIGTVGMGWAYYAALALTFAALVHLGTIQIDEPEPELPDDASAGYVDVRGALEAIRAVPGLALVILVTAFNNLLSGVFMALMDPYGLNLVSVETWGILWGGISVAFIVGGLAVSRFGLGSNPLRLILLANLVNWTICSVFCIRSSVVLLTIGMVVWLAMIPVIEAGEQTVLQRTIPFERQGRVFGFAQLVENAASPLTAFFMAPLAEIVFIPFMSAVARRLDRLMVRHRRRPGHCADVHARRLIGVVVTVAALSSRSYRRLSDRLTDRSAVSP